MNLESTPTKDDIECAHQVVTKKSNPSEIDTSIPVKGYDFSGPFNFKDYVKSLSSTGIQSTSLAKAISIINNMIQEKLRLGSRMKIFLGFTSNIGSSGMREAINYLCSHKMIDVICTTAGAIEEDIMKTIAPHYINKNDSSDQSLRENGINRIYNMLVPNDNYVLFEEFMNKVIETMVQEQRKGKSWTPSKLVSLLGFSCQKNESWVHNCFINSIPVYSPAIVDGSIGDMIYFSQNSKKELKLDTIEDLCEINSIPIHAEKTGVIILGGGLVKHHIFNANLMRNGTDYAVVVNTAIESDGSDAGANTGEAVTWGKIAENGMAVKVHAEVSLVLPTIIAATFKEFEKDFSELNN